MSWLFKDLINGGLAQFYHGQSNSKKWAKGKKDHTDPVFQFCKNLKNLTELIQSYDDVPFSGPESPFVLKPFL